MVSKEAFRDSLERSDFAMWMAEHADESPSALRLRHRDRDVEIIQIECRQKGRKKLERLLERHPKWLFAEPLAVEQSTSDALAMWHASLVHEGATVVDLTGGAGVDAAYMAERGCRVTIVELDPVRAAVIAANLPECEVVTADCRDFLKTVGDRRWDVAFIDPGRRDDAGQRLFGLRDCRPDVVAMQALIMAHADMLIVKASPMIDIAASVAELSGCRVAAAVGTTRECRELVLICAKSETTDDCEIRAVTLHSDGSELEDITFTRAEEAVAEVRYAQKIQAGQYLYEPWPAVMKAGPFRLLASRYGVEAVGANTHVYVADDEKTFPGVCWRIDEVQEFTSGNIKRLARRGIGPQTDVMTRNFPLGAEYLRHRLVKPKGASGVEAVMFLTDAAGGKLMLVMSRR